LTAQTSVNDQRHREREDDLQWNDGEQKQKGIAHCFVERGVADHALKSTQRKIACFTLKRKQKCLTDWHNNQQREKSD